MPSMRGSTGRHGRRMKNEINVVPYIDVMLVLLVIFMVTAPMITPGLVELPSVGQASEVPAKPVEIQVDKDGKLAIRLRDAGSEFMNIEKSTLLSEVRSRMQADSPVVIAADGKVPYETVMGLMDELRSNGINRLGLIVDRNSDPDARK
ncbi:protein TolR [Alcaligenes ammonioxydans]|jgi:biopolymer transport protein TolR|uniref:Protein TolR n=1 Tax=Alcaligenes ammonioxydans TaxID=2582914 RepID=A0ABX8SYE5_9BURK|nr:protein TolR [Alcaligenes ammonioxydans]EJC61075.1 TolR-like translocation protein [Alcaligenes faecalis subsp. faecalis NCIB 8687]QBH18819.1 protein TolR [Alcaligenes faecalis]MCH1881106.1 protein TolR [Alcaligenes ammonioxydans]QXX79928.1 protein TolR [Alcaligenes ammonioxydans]WGQ34887.1 protein TolR [Alcaligenes faecalis]